jgi:hypothetical protein
LIATCICSQELEFYLASNYQVIVKRGKPGVIFRTEEKIE